MNNTHSDDSDGIVVVTTLIAAFMVFFMCFALRMCFASRYISDLMISSPEEVQSPPLYVDEQQPPAYDEELIPPPVYIDVTLTTEPRVQSHPA